MKKSLKLLIGIPALILLITACEKNHKYDPEESFKVHLIPGGYSCDIYVQYFGTYDSTYMTQNFIEERSISCNAEIKKEGEYSYTATFHSNDSIMPSNLSFEIRRFHIYSAWFDNTPTDVRAKVGLPETDSFKMYYDRFSRSFGEYMDNYIGYSYNTRYEFIRWNVSLEREPDEFILRIKMLKKQIID